jgi:hypothetical protein
MKENYKIFEEFNKPNQKVPLGDDNWYKHCGIVVNKIRKDFPESEKYLNQLIIAHMLDLFLYEDKLEVMNYLYSLNNIKSKFEYTSKEYFEKNSISINSETFFIMYKLNEMVLMKLDSNNKWIKGGSEDMRELIEYLNKIVKGNKNSNKKYTAEEVEQAEDILAFDIARYNAIIGFIGYDKNNKYLVFKTKDMTSKRETGAICSQATKNKNLLKLKNIIGEGNYAIENLKNDELCVLEELILRYFDVIKREDKKWFLTPEMALKHSLYKLYVKK